MIEPRLDFKHLKRTVAITQVLAAAGLIAHFRKRSNTLVGPCPIHQGDNANAFVINLEKNVWHCFTRCNAGGDVVDLVRRLYRCNYRRAAEILASNGKAPTAFAGALSKSPSPKRTFMPYTKRLRLEADTPLLRQRGILPVTAQRFEAGAYVGPGFLSNCVAVRLHDLNGHPIGYAGRRRDLEQARRFGKWKFPPRLPKRELLYNFQRVGSVHTLLVVESPWSVMRLAQIGVPSVALLGCHLSVVQQNLLSKFRRLALLFDGDPAGRNAANQIQTRLQSRKDVYVINLPEGKDPQNLSDDQLRAFLPNLFSF